jgi:hypothetical protein
VAQSLTLTPDGATLVFGSGGSGSANTLKAVPLAGGSITTLDNTAGYVNIFAVY